MNPLLHLPSYLEGAIRVQAGAVNGPFYLYETAGIRQICRNLTALAYPHTSIHFAVQANAHARVLALVQEEGVGIFVNSTLHLRQALAAGFAGRQIVFTASAMDAPTMQEAHDAGVMVNLDSLGQIARWRAQFPGAPFGVRCNIGTLIEPRQTGGAYYIGRQSRLGLRPEEIATLAGSPDVCGLHLYAGTNLNDLAYFRTCYEALASFVPLFPALELLNVGGGLALTDAAGADFDFAAYGQMVAEVLTAASAVAGRPLHLALEPGRIIPGLSGYFVCRVIDVKPIDGRQFLGVNASTAQFPRPLMHPDSAVHPVTLLPADAAAARETLPSTIYGCSTYSRDYLATEAALPPAEPGDLIVLGEAGAYSASSYTQFLGFPPAAEYFL
jgi:diaminopimelate decarboxylase